MEYVQDGSIHRWDSYKSVVRNEWRGEKCHFSKSCAPALAMPSGVEAGSCFSTWKVPLMRTVRGGVQRGGPGAAGR